MNVHDFMCRLSTTLNAEEFQVSFELANRYTSVLSPIVI